MRSGVRLTLILAGISAAIFLGSFAGGCSSLDQKFVFPGTATHGRPEAAVLRSERYEVLTLPLRDGTKIAAEFGRALDANGRAVTDSARRPTVIFFYGNGSCLAWSEEQFEHFRRLGANVLIPEYPGYGLSEGRASEAGCYATADAAYAYLLGRPDVDRSLIIAAGWSLGGAVAIDLARRQPVAGLITVSAFTTFLDVAHHAAPYAPASLLLRSRFDNLAKIPAITCPILIAHGTLDQLVPVPMADQLAAAASHPVQCFRVETGGHNDVFAVGGDALWKTFGAFLADAVAKR